MANVKITDLTAASAAAKSMLFEVTQDPSGTPATRKLSLTQLLNLDDGTRTSSAPLLNMAQTWNSGGTTFTALKFNVTDTASAAASLLLQLQVGGSNIFTVKKDGSFAASYLSFDGTSANMTLGTCGFNYPSGVLTGVSLVLNDTNVASPLTTALAEATAGVFAIRGGATAQALRVYNTYTDASNYERGVFDWKTTSNVLTIGTQNAGTGSARALKFVVGGTTALDISTGANATFAGDVTLGGSLVAQASSYLQWSGRSIMRSPSDGTIALLDSSLADFNRLLFGGSTSSFPAIKRNGAGLKFVVADDSASAAIEALSLTVSSSGKVCWGTTSGDVKLEKSSQSLLMLLGDGSNYCSLQASNAYFHSSGVRLDANGPLIWTNAASNAGSTADLILRRYAAGQMGIYDGSNPQGILVFNTYTDGSNYERLNIGFSSNLAQILTEAAGTGTVRSLVLGTGGSGRWYINASTGDWYAYTDATYDIGALNAARPRSGYFSASLIAGTFVKVGSYTVAGVPSASTAGAGAIIYVSNESGGATLAFSDGTNWKRVTDNATIS